MAKKIKKARTNFIKKPVHFSNTSENYYGQKEYAVSQQTFQKVQSLKQKYPNIGSGSALKAIKRNSEGALGFVNQIKGIRNKGIHATKKQLSKMSGFANVGIFESRPEIPEMEIKADQNLLNKPAKQALILYN